MVLSHEFTVSQGRSMPLRLNSRLNMAFIHVKTSLLATQNLKRKTRGEMERRRCCPTTTTIYFDGYMPPPREERRTRQNTAQGGSVRGTISKQSIKRSNASGSRIEDEIGNQNTGTVDCGGGSEGPYEYRRDLKPI